MEFPFGVPHNVRRRGLPPGQYRIDVHVSFRDVPSQMPRFYRARIRLNMPDQQSGEDSVLEIDSDDQTLVNMQGCDLKQFSKVVLKGRGAGVINVLQTPEQDASQDAQRRTADKPETAFEYKLRIDAEKQSRMGELDGLRVREGVVFVFTTNAALSDLDPTFLRPGRIDVVAPFTCPDAELRRRFVLERWQADVRDALDVEQVVADTAGDHSPCGLNQAHQRAPGPCWDEVFPSL